MKTHFVLDAWAVLALIQGEEPAASRVNALLEDALQDRIQLSISIINLGEVTYRIGKTRGADAAYETLDEIERLPVDVLPATEEAVWAAVAFKMDHPISYADAFAAAAADSLEAVLVTGDPELVELKGRLRVDALERAR